jgi:hypothetical protein
VNLLDESDLQKLMNLLTDDLVLPLVEVAQALLHQFGAGSDFQGVLGDFPRYAQHIRGTPHKYVGIRTEKVDEHGFLFGVEGGADFQRLLVRAGRVEGHELDILCGLKAIDVTLGVRDLLGQTVEVCGQGCRLQEGLPVFDALHVALVDVLVGGPMVITPLGPDVLSLR